LNMEMMNQGVALAISQIRPDTNIEKEFQPASRDKVHVDIFTPPETLDMER